MKKTAFLSFALLSLFLVSFTINSNQKNVKLILDPNKSSISWKGYKLVKSDLSSHYGVAKLKEGEVTLNPSTKSIVSGKAVIDMNTFESVDLNDSPDMKAKLDGHLKSADFLDIEKFPTVTFKVTSYKKLNSKKYNAQITGDLTMKGITKSVTFKALAKGNMSKIEFKSEEFDINRQDWGIVYKGSGESLIKDVVTMQINLLAVKAK